MCELIQSKRFYITTWHDKVNQDKSRQRQHHSRQEVHTTSYLRRQRVTGKRKRSCYSQHKDKTQMPHTCWGLTVGAAQTPVGHKDDLRVAAKTFQVSHWLLTVRLYSADLGDRNTGVVILVIVVSDLSPFITNYWYCSLYSFPISMSLMSLTLHFPPPLPPIQFHQTTFSMLLLSYSFSSFSFNAICKLRGF